MNVILLFPEDFIDANRVRLGGRRAAHIREIHRAAPGSSLRVGLVNDRIGCGVVTAMDEGRVELEVRLTEPPPAAVPLTLIVALPRPKIVRRILQSVAALGVKRIVLVNSWRVDKSYWSSPVLAPDALREQLVLGLEQACDTVLPEVSLRRRFKPFVEDEAPALVDGRVALVAHPAAAEPCPCDIDRPVLLAVGPEGGFIKYEIDLLVAHGFRAVSLGPRRLRTEHAITAAIARLC
jgi:RsmE family RNA methyltransferase